MNPDVILVRYGELALKGKNRSDFEDRLVQNIRWKLADIPSAKVVKSFGRIFIEAEGSDTASALRKLGDVFGVVGFSPAERVESDPEAIKGAALRLIEYRDPFPRTFKVTAKRADKSFPLSSGEINRQVGAHILRNVKGIKVDVHQPELTVHVEVRGKYTYVYGDDLPGPGGLPVGTSGKVMLLLSGGIDSPVAGYLSLKRGAELLAVHFHSYPYTSERSRQKVIDLARILTRFAGKIRLHIVPFTEIQTEIRQKCLESYSITVMRRMMFRIAEQLARREGALALVTGESLGQVASQTLESMNAINEVAGLPVLRPLIGMDKQDIMSLSKEIGTYETSVLPYEDCCTVFMPRSPKTRPDLETTRKTESRLDVDRLVEAAVKGTEVLELVSGEEKEFTYF
jgi:thiamine biosynthesis protein ThiI